ncbi:hypothetical protein QBC43DRAFT_231032 [Cladorrhinum sp. PSN259]|nr:hypothetical protein QBC43DRAFT_231032 [Cladorrhinum sp. PSN259]
MDNSTSIDTGVVANGTHSYNDRRLTDDEFDRYSRQMIVPGMGKEAQLRLINSRVLIIGAGGLGCPAAQYVAAAGVGTLGIVDGDVVEMSNLHRQVGHATSRIGLKKVDSLVTHLKDLNPLPTFITHPCHISPQNAAQIISHYDLVMDCTDNAATRYLISDVCVLLQKPLVSAASVQKSGQLIVLNCPPAPQGLLDKPYPPCYRCCFRKPPPPSAMATCGEAGIMGTVVGMMGVAQAGEAIKVIASGLHSPPSPLTTTTSSSPDTTENDHNLTKPYLLLYTYDLSAGIGSYTFRAVKMGSRKKNCFACGDNSPSTLTLEGIKQGNPNYEQFCGFPAPKSSTLQQQEEQRISASAYHRAKLDGTLSEHILIDTREKEHFSFGSIEGAINMPFGTFLTNVFKIKKKSGEENGKNAADDILPPEAKKLGDDAPIVFVCRRGLDSQEAVEKLKELGVDKGGKRRIMDIRGGMKAWKEEVDPDFQFI